MTATTEFKRGCSHEVGKTGPRKNISDREFTGSQAGRWGRPTGHIAVLVGRLGRPMARGVGRHARGRLIGRVDKAPGTSHGDIPGAGDAISHTHA